VQPIQESDPMARPTTFATPICIGLTLLAGIGIVLGLMTEEVLYTVAFLMPTVAYEVYRTEGRSTRWASWAMALLVVALFAAVVAGFEFDLREIFGADVTYLDGQEIPLGDVKVVFPAIMAILAVVLWTRTRGTYTRWLAAIIFVTSAFVVHLSAPEMLGDLLDRVS
jgi:uncharacterized membrane protein YhaH (DUF805 family)